MAIAYAVMRHLAETTKCKTLFITHYPLVASEMARQYSEVSNGHMGFIEETQHGEFLVQPVSSQAKHISFSLSLSQMIPARFSSCTSSPPIWRAAAMESNALCLQVFPALSSTKLGRNPVSWRNLWWDAVQPISELSRRLKVAERQLNERT